MQSVEPPVEVVAGRYRLISLLGRGGMGSVWRGEHTSLGTEVAIKVLDARFAEKEGFRARFIREAKAAATLKSKHVVQVFDHGVEGDVPFIVMEFLHGESLASRLARERVLDGPTTARILVDAGRAIAKAHAAGIIHRDLKPDNIFLADVEEETDAGFGRSGRFVGKVLDFGIAKALEQGVLKGDVSTDTGSLLGTPHYMSPEQLRGSKAVDARADLWSLAVIAFQCIVGRKPFSGDAIGELVLAICGDPPPVPSSIAPVPPGFDAWFAHATSRDIDARHASVSELIRSLEDVLTPGTHLFESIAGRTSMVPPAAFDATELANAATATPSGASTAATPVHHEPAVTTQATSTKSITPSARRRAVPTIAIVAAIAAAGAAAGIGVALSGSSSGRDTPSSAAPTPPAPSSALAAPGRPTPSVAVSASPTPPPSASEAALREIVVTLRTTPKGASLFRDGVKLGDDTAPIKLPWTEKPFQVSVQKPGFISRTATIDPRPTVDLDVTLTAPRPVNTETPD